MAISRVLLPDLPHRGRRGYGAVHPGKAGEGDTRASDNPTAICLARLKEIATLPPGKPRRPILAEAACAFWAQWRALSVHGRRRLRGRPLELVHLADEGVGGGGSAGVGDGGANGDGEVGLSGGVGCGRHSVTPREAALREAAVPTRWRGGGGERGRRLRCGRGRGRGRGMVLVLVVVVVDARRGGGGGVHIGDGHAASRSPRSVRSIHAVGSVVPLAPSAPPAPPARPNRLAPRLPGAAPLAAGGSRGGSTRRAAPHGTRPRRARGRILGRRHAAPRPARQLRDAPAVSPSGSRAVPRLLCAAAPAADGHRAWAVRPGASRGTLPQGAAPRGASGGTPPGPTASPLSDTELFCGGACRATYAGRRCRGSLRQQVARLDGASCAQCGLDAPSLCQQLAEAPPGQLRGNPRQARTGDRCGAPAGREALEHPHVASNAWHADHHAVFEGGGECTVENMQVLCVACHKQKTRREASERAQRRRDERRDAVAAAAIAAAALPRVPRKACAVPAASAGRAPARQLQAERTPCKRQRHSRRSAHRGADSGAGHDRAREEPPRRSQAVSVLCSRCVRSLCADSFFSLCAERAVHVQPQRVYTRTW